MPARPKDRPVGVAEDRPTGAATGGRAAGTATDGAAGAARRAAAATGRRASGAGGGVTDGAASGVTGSRARSRTGGGGAAAVEKEALTAERRQAPRRESRTRLAMAAESDYEAFRHSLRRGQVTFHDVACAWFHMSDSDLTEAQREPFKQLFPHLLDAFAEPRGGIVTSYFCRHIRVAAALTDIDSAARRSEGVPTSTPRDPLDGGARTTAAAGDDEQRTNGHDAPATHRHHWWHRAPDRPEDDDQPPPGQSALRPFRPNPASSSAIHIEPTFGDPEDWHAKALLFRCLHLHYKALEFLTPQPRKICMRLIFGVITALLGTLDSHRARGEQGATDDALELETLEQELAEAERYYEAAAQRQAQLEYLVGMLMALAVAGAAVAVLAIAGVNPLGDPLGVSLISGGIGGVLSVMTRMTSGSLRLRAEAGTWAIRAVGGIRPIVGAAFGAAIYVLLAGHIVDVLQPPSGDTTLFYAGLGFLAGFSERFAQDAIAGATAAKAVAADPAIKPR